MPLSVPSMYAKAPPAYARLSASARDAVDSVDARNVRPSQLKSLADKLFRDNAISRGQKMELEMIRKAYAGDGSDEPLDLVRAMDDAAAFVAGVQHAFPGSGCVAYYRTMVDFARWLDGTSSLHRRAPILNTRA